MQTIVLEIGGMACGGCASTVRQALLALEGVAEAEVSHADGRATVQFDAAMVAPEQLRTAVKAAGYQAS